MTVIRTTAAVLFLLIGLLGCNGAPTDPANSKQKPTPTPSPGDFKYSTPKAWRP